MKLLTAAFLVLVLAATPAFGQTPEITGHNITSLRTVEFNFSIPVYRSTVEDQNNSMIYPDGDPGNPLEKWTIYLASGLVTMQVILIEPMTDGDVFTISLDGIRATNGEFIEEGYEYSFTVTDLAPPQLQSVIFLAPDQVDLVFSEDIVESEGEDLSGYSMYETAAPANTIGINDIRMRGIYTHVHLELDQDLVYGTEYTISASGLHDLCGNPLPVGSEVTFTYTGENSRSVMGLFADYDRLSTAVSGTDQYSFDIWYWVKPKVTGAIGAAFSVGYPDNVIPYLGELSPLCIWPQGDLFSSVAVTFDGCATDWIWMYRQTITVTDAAPSILSIRPYDYGDRKNLYYLDCDDVHTELIMGAISNIEINAPDARPRAISASFSGNTIIDILFNIHMDQSTSETASNYELFETASPGSAVSISSASLMADGRTVRLETATDLTAGIDYTVRMTGVESAAGRAIYPGSEIVFSSIDEVRPYLVSAARTAQLAVDISFNEPVDPKTAGSVLNYDIVKTSDSGSHARLPSAVAPTTLPK